MIGTEKNNNLLHIKAERAYQKNLRRGKANHLKNKLLGRGGSSLKKFKEDKNEEQATKTFTHSGTPKVNLADIVGSVSRPDDFDQYFRPKNASSTSSKWKNIYKVWHSSGNLPPLKLYRIKQDYYVEDGHHRVSVLRSLGVDQLESDITEYIPTKQTKENEAYQEGRRFLKKTGIEIFLSEPRDFHTLEELIKNYGKARSIDNFREAAQDWYHNIYRPVVTIINETDFAKQFPDSTEAELFLWVKNHNCTEHHCPVKDITSGQSGWERGRTSKSRKRLIQQVCDDDTIQSCPLVQWVEDHLHGGNIR